MKRIPSLCIFAFFFVLASHSATLHPDTIAARMWRQLALIPQEKLYTQTDRSCYSPGDTIWVRHHIAEETTGTPALASRYVYVELIDPEGYVVSRSMMRQEPHGAIYGYVPTKVGMGTGCYILRAYTRYMTDTSPSYLFCRQIWLRGDGTTTKTHTDKEANEEASEAISLQLWPEGGHLVMGQRCRVAYKAMSVDGLGVDMKAIVTDDLGERLTENTATHCGIGAFDITPQPGHTYTITCSDGGTRHASALLPMAYADLPTLQITQNASDIIVNVICPDGFDKLNKTWLIADQRGAPVYAQPLTTRTIRFSRKMFRDGMAHFVLADNKMNIISERMAFVLDGKDVYASDAAIYASPASQGMYRVDLLVPDNLEADCAISITADNGNDYESTSDIVSTMLLTQELDGMVENPSWYFADRQRMAALDTLMLTQKWRRYNMQAVLKGKPTTTESYPEAGMQISGRVTAGKSAHGVADSKVTVVANHNGYTDTVVTDDEGRFVFGGFELPDSTAYMFAATDAKGKGGVTLRLDGHRFPDLPDDVRLRLRHATADADTTTMHDERTVVLPELSVVARSTPRTQYESQAKFGGKSIKGDELERKKDKDIMSLLRSAGIGLTYNANKEWLEYRRQPVYLVVDGTSWAYDTLMAARPMSSILSAMSARQVRQIDIIRGAAVGSLGITGADTYGALSDSQCAIVITTRREDTPTTAQKRDNVAAKLILGYQKKAVFDNNKGAAPNGSDTTRTIYWNPSMVMYGKSSFLFHPGGARRCRVTVEGISRQGQLIHLEKRLTLR